MTSTKLRSTTFLLFFLPDSVVAFSPDDVPGAAGFVCAFGFLRQITWLPLPSAKVHKFVTALLKTLGER